MSVLDKPKRFEVHLYVAADRFKNSSWKYDVGEELFILGQELMKGMDVIPSKILDHGGSIGEVIIDYSEDDGPATNIENPGKAEPNVHVDKLESSDDWRHELADIFIRIAAELKL